MYPAIALGEGNSCTQTTLEIPTSNYQIPANRHIPNLNGSTAISSACRLGAVGSWDLGFHWDLEFGRGGRGFRLRGTGYGVADLQFL